MSNVRKQIISCPLCGSNTEITVYPSINTMLNPELVPKLISGELTRHKCDCCGGEFNGLYRILVNDMLSTPARFIYFTTEDHIKELKQQPENSLKPIFESVVGFFEGPKREYYSDWGEFVKAVATIEVIPNN